jgi:hypothetical protein
VAEKRRKEKRKTDRIQPFVAPCRVLDGESSLTAYLTDLSLKGARISSDDPLMPGAQSVVLEIHFSRSPPCRLPARIQWIQPGVNPGEAAVFGVTFDRHAADDRALLESVVKEFRRRAALLA